MGGVVVKANSREWFWGGRGRPWQVMWRLFPLVAEGCRAMGAAPEP
jgi:hypothetical protein